MASRDPLWDLLEAARQRWQGGHIAQCETDHATSTQTCAHEEDQGYNQCTRGED